MTYLSDELAKIKEQDLEGEAVQGNVSMLVDIVTVMLAMAEEWHKAYNLSSKYSGYDAERLDLLDDIAYDIEDAIVKGLSDE